MTCALLAHNAQLCKLASFMHFHSGSKILSLSDALAYSNGGGGGGSGRRGGGGGGGGSGDSGDDTLGAVFGGGGADPGVHGMLWGYGFCYVNTASLVAATPWQPINFGEGHVLTNRH